MNKHIALYLSGDDVMRTGGITPENSNCVIEESFSLVAQNDFLMGGPSGSEHGIQLPFPKRSDIPGMPLQRPDYRYMAMVSYVGGGYRVCGTKVYGSNAENTSRGLLRSHHVILLNDAETGLPLAIMNGTQISNMRTGAVAGVGAKYLAPREAKVCGLVGAGVLNRAALRCIAAVVPGLKRVYVYDVVEEKSRRFAEEMADLPLEVIPASSEEEMLPLCDILHYGTNAIRPLPLVEPERLKQEALVEISCLVEYPERLLQDVNIVVDLLRMHEVWHQTDPEQNLATFPILEKIGRGELECDRILELGKIITGEQTFDRGGRVTLFMANGLPVWDVALAHSVYRSAKEKGIGLELPL